MRMPLYVTGLSTEGNLLIGGIFDMKDTLGFPLDMSYEIVKEKGWAIDYCELLCSAWLNDCLKFDAICRELDLLESSHVEEWKRAGTAFLNKYPKALSHPRPIDVFCRYILQKKKLKKDFDRPSCVCNS